LKKQLEITSGLARLVSLAQNNETFYDLVFNLGHPWFWVDDCLSRAWLTSCAADMLFALYSAVFCLQVSYFAH
jgi:hypothetical protein